MYAAANAWSDAPTTSSKNSSLPIANWIPADFISLNSWPIRKGLVSNPANTLACDRAASMGDPSGVGSTTPSRTTRASTAGGGTRKLEVATVRGL